MPDDLLPLNTVGLAFGITFFLMGAFMWNVNLLLTAAFFMLIGNAGGFVEEYQKERAERVS